MDAKLTGLIKRHLNLDVQNTDEDEYLSLLWNSALNTARQITRLPLPCTQEDPLPDDIALAVLNHVARLYEQRGDCDCTASPGASLPAQSMDTYHLYKKWEIV